MSLRVLVARLPSCPTGWLPGFLLLPCCLCVLPCVLCFSLLSCVLLYFPLLCVCSYFSLGVHVLSLVFFVFPSLSGNLFVVFTCCVCLLPCVLCLLSCCLCFLPCCLCFILCSQHCSTRPHRLPCWLQPHGQFLHTSACPASECVACVRSHTVKAKSTHGFVSGRHGFSSDQIQFEKKKRLRSNMGPLCRITPLTSPPNFRLLNPQRQSSRRTRLCAVVHVCGCA